MICESIMLLHGIESNLTFLGYFDELTNVPIENWLVDYLASDLEKFCRNIDSVCVGGGPYRCPHGEVFALANASECSLLHIAATSWHQSALELLEDFRFDFSDVMPYGYTFPETVVEKEIEFKRVVDLFLNDRAKVARALPTPETVHLLVARLESEWQRVLMQQMRSSRPPAYDQAKYGVDDVPFYPVQRLFCEGSSDPKLSDSVEAGLNELERIETKKIAAMPLQPDGIESSTGLLDDPVVTEGGRDDSEEVEEIDCLIKAEERLKLLRLKLFQALVKRKHFTSFETIKYWGDCFRRVPASDDAIEKALKEIKEVILDLPIEVEFSLRDRRAKIYRQN